MKNKCCILTSYNMLGTAEKFLIFISYISIFLQSSFYKLRFREGAYLNEEESIFEATAL